MPFNLNELKNGTVNPKRKGGKKIDFKPITKKIIASGQYWSVKEVHEQFVQKKVTRFRTMKLLNREVKGLRLMKIDRKGTYYYGKYDKTIVQRGTA